eukprot:165119-Alexandrium_andersonii.AAC.1
MGPPAVEAREVLQGPGGRAGARRAEAWGLAKRHAACRHHPLTPVGQIGPCPKREGGRSPLA